MVLEREPTPARTEEMVPPCALSAVAMSTVPPSSDPLTRVTLLVTVVVVRLTVLGTRTPPTGIKHFQG